MSATAKRHWHIKYTEDEDVEHTIRVRHDVLLPVDDPPHFDDQGWFVVGSIITNPKLVHHLEMWPADGGKEISLEEQKNE